MEENSTIQTYIKSLYEAISINELTIIANSTEEEIAEQKKLHQAFGMLNKKVVQPSEKSIQSILEFSANTNPKLDTIH